MKNKDFLSLAELNSLIAETIQDTFSGKAVRVLAEISDFKDYPQRQYCFFSLVQKEEGRIVARSEAVIWRNQYTLLQRFRQETGRALSPGIEVMLHVAVDYHPVYGFKLVVHNIDTAYTLGAMELDKTRVVERLLKEHSVFFKQLDGEWKSQNNLLILPVVIRSIVLITGKDSDGQRDFLHEIQTNPQGYVFSIRVIPALVQGEQAPASIAAALREAASEAPDIIVLARGGGAQTDLDVFDRYEPVLEIARCQIPVLCGIGHERNVSLCDRFANMTQKTPTAAAAFILGMNMAFEEELLGWQQELAYEVRGRIQNYASRLGTMSLKLWQMAGRQILRKESELIRFSEAFKQNDPINTLKKGYTLVKQNGKIIPSTDKLNEHQVFEIHWHNGIKNIEAK